MRKISPLLCAIAAEFFVFGNVSLQQGEIIREPIRQIEEKAAEPENYRIDDFSKDKENFLLARMIMGEAEDCIKTEKIGVGYTAINRLKEEYGSTLKKVILEPFQYSCFNKGIRREALKNPLEYDFEEFMMDLAIAEGILSGEYKDPTKGATHYYNPKLVKKPHWTRMMKEVGRIKEGKRKSKHVFYR
ncbi:Cell Wall Hydrolase [uncultured archaeon]|nr:Cell Wall Hydrolase [uncultured archaeon]